MEIETRRLVLRPWRESDAASLYHYAKDPEVGPIAGWPPHRSLTESLAVIRGVFCAEECYALCRKEDARAIGCIELKGRERSDMVGREDERELGFWIGREFWGRGLMPEAAEALIRHGFEDLGLNVIWCGYYEGNARSRRVQEKLGFRCHHRCDAVPVPLLGESRIGYMNCLTREQWKKKRSGV